MTSDQRMQAFRATDAFAVEAYRAASALSKSAAQALAVEIRKSAVRSGGAVVAASASAPGGEQEQAHLERARVALVEGRYYLYLARRFGLLDPKRYRALTSRQDAALRELQALLEAPPAPPGLRAPA
jgi:four helix bundle protein